MGYFMFDKRRLAGDGVSSVTEMSLRKTYRRQAASHSSPWLQQDLGMTLSTGVSMIGVLEITLIVPTLCVGMPPRTLRVRSRVWRRCVPHSGALSTSCARLTESPVCAISVDADLCITLSAERGRNQRVCVRPCSSRACAPVDAQAWTGRVPSGVLHSMHLPGLR